jgi:CHASE2 domain-containing sensor protein
MPNQTHKKIFLSSFVCFIIAVLLLNCFQGIFKLIDRVSPFTNKVEDYELFDLYLAYAHPERPEPRIVIVDCSKKSRNEIAVAISAIEKQHPLVIGVDILFSNPSPAADDKRLIQVIDSNRKNIVLGYIDYSPFYHRLKANGDYYQLGFIEMNSDILTQRSFLPYRRNYNMGVDTSFVVKIASIAHQVDPALCAYTDSKEARELINFRRGINDESRFNLVYDYNDSTAFRHRIVLLGGINTKTREDMHFSPLNGEIGRSHEDMFGVEISAQAISTIIRSDYIRQLNIFLKYILLFVYCWAFCFLKIWFSRRFEKFEPQLMLFSFILLTFLLMVQSVLFMTFLDYKVEPMEFMITMLLALVIYPKLPHLHRWIYMGAKQIVKNYEI